MATLNKKETIKNIMQLLDNGYTVYINGGCLGGSLWETQDRGKTIIKWSRFGASANRRTIEELTWIINTIFECKYKKVVYTYK